MIIGGKDGRLSELFFAVRCTAVLHSQVQS